MASYNPWAAMAESENKEIDRERAKRNHEVNREVRKKERKKRKERLKKYIGGVKARDLAPVGVQTGLKKFVLTTKKEIPPIVQTPRELGLYDIVPKVVEYPTATLTSTRDTIGEGYNIPWTATPIQLGLPAFSTAVGTLMIMVGNHMVAALASRMTGVGMSGIDYTVADGRVRIRLHTGKGAGRGRYVRPRGEGGESPDDDADPYDQPSEWWEFWKWSL